MGPLLLPGGLLNLKHGVNLKQQKLSDMCAHEVRDAIDSDYDEAVRAIRANPGYGHTARIQKEFSERGIILEKNRLYRALNAGIVETPAVSSRYPATCS